MRRSGPVLGSGLFLMQLLRNPSELLSGAAGLHPVLTLAKKIFNLWTPGIPVCKFTLA